VNYMPHFKYAFDLRPGDVLADDPERDTQLHNGDPRIVRVARIWEGERDTMSITFADKSITEFSTQVHCGPYLVETP
jgi:hypothetical protein